MANQNQGGAGGVIAMLLLIGWIWSAVDGDSSSGVSATDTSYSDSSYTDTEFGDSSDLYSTDSDFSPEITAEMVVAAGFSGRDIRQFCVEYFTIGNYDLALMAFEGGYGAAQDPSAEEVFDELLSRC